MKFTEIIDTLPRGILINHMEIRAQFDVCAHAALPLGDGPQRVERARAAAPAPHELVVRVGVAAVVEEVGGREQRLPRGRGSGGTNIYRERQIFDIYIYMYIYISSWGGKNNIHLGRKLPPIYPD